MKEEEERRACELFYASAVANATSDEEELAIALQLLEAAQRGQVPNDTGTGLIYAQAGDLPVDADWMVDGQEARQKKQRLRQIALVAGGLLVAILFIIITGSGGGKGRATPTPAITGQSQLRQVLIATLTLTPAPATPTSTGTPTPIPSLTPTSSPVPAREVEVRAPVPTLEPGAVVPVSLEIADRYYPIVPTTLRDDDWAYVTDPTRISWLTGSYVNLILGLPYSTANLDLMATTLHISDTLTLRNNVAGVNHYQIAGRQSVSIYEIEALAQRRAGLTLVLVGGNDENADSRLVIWAIPQTGKEGITAP